MFVGAFFGFKTVTEYTVYSIQIIATLLKSSSIKSTSSQEELSFCVEFLTTCLFLNNGIIQPMATAGGDGLGYF